MRKIGRSLLQGCRDMTLFQKMLFFYIVMLCIPSLLIGTFYIGNLSHKLNEEYKRGKAELLKQSIYSVENGLTRVSFCTSSFQYNTGLLSYVENYDFTTGQGAEMWIRYIKPAFEQIRDANPDFDNICIWRKNNKLINDPRYVLNKADNPDLSDMESMTYKSMEIFFENEGEETECRIYKGLFNVNPFSNVGYVEVDADFNVLFSPLEFMEEKETLFLTHDNEVYRVNMGKNGRLWLTEGSKEHINEHNRISEQIESLEIQLDYNYQDFVVLSDSTVMTVILGALLLFLFFTVVYYAFYLSVTRRITNLTVHMEQDFGERMQPYREDPNGDEIGTLVRVYNQMVGRINLLNDEILQKERLVNQAQYYAMQSQIDPHFLYNTLENINMLIEIEENDKASKMIASFGKMLRYNLSRRREMSTVEEEVSHAEDYLKLYAYRMSNNFSWQIEMDPACRSVTCPYCMLQPVVENCFKHGFRNPDRAFWVHVKVFCQEGYVWIEVKDNGEGIDGKRLEEVRSKLESSVREEEKEESSIGLGNVHERIVLLCGAGSGLWIVPQTQGCLIRIAIRI